MKIRPSTLHPLLTALGDISGEQYVLDTLKDTKSRYLDSLDSKVFLIILFFDFSEIETTLLILDFEHVKKLIEILCLFLDKNIEIELCLRCAVFVLK